ncbi:MAG: methionyl-tRNA formyltransferase [Planctomycetota bacterium]
MRLVFFGSGTFGLASLEALLRAGCAPVLVVTPPPRRRRRGGRAEPTPVHAAAATAGIEVITPTKVNEEATLERLREAGAALFVVAEYGQILSQALLDIPPEGTLNVHASLLPRWRGATPVSAAILAGDEETGITIQRTVRKLDAGPILATRRVCIEPGEQAGTLAARLAPLGGELLVEVMEALAAGNPPTARPQDESQVTFCKRLTAEDAQIEWTRSAAEIARMIRAYHPKPGARTSLQREPPLAVDLRAAEAVAGTGPPGVVAAVGREHFDVGTGDGLLRVRELVPAARKPMGAQAFLNGYRLSVGERFC